MGSRLMFGVCPFYRSFLFLGADFDLGLFFFRK